MTDGDQTATEAERPVLTEEDVVRVFWDRIAPEWTAALAGAIRSANDHVGASPDRASSESD